MGEIRRVPLVRPLAGLLSPQPELLEQAIAKLTGLFGPVFTQTKPAAFSYTTYYNQEMGEGIFRQFVVFSRLVSPDDLADWKITTNAWEQQLGGHPKGGRRINIDPGYLAPGKLVLASTKDHEQRVYLRNGIWAEITLRVRNKQFTTWEWSYPDYAAAVDFFNAAYHDYLAELAREKS